MRRLHGRRRQRPVDRELGPRRRRRSRANLNFYNWAQYHDPKNAKEFSKKFGVAFNESNYTSNEELLTKLQTTKGQSVYDIIVPDADHVRIEKRARPADAARPQPDPQPQEPGAALAQLCRTTPATSTR